MTSHVHNMDCSSDLLGTVSFLDAERATAAKRLSPNYGYNHLSSQLVFMV